MLVNNAFSTIQIIYDQMVEQMLIIFERNKIAVACFAVLSRHFPVRTWENHETPPSRCTRFVSEEDILNTGPSGSTVIQLKSII